MSQVNTQADLRPYLARIAAAKKAGNSQDYVKHMAKILLVLPDLKNTHDRHNITKSLLNALKKADWLRADKSIATNVAYLEDALLSLNYPTTERFLNVYSQGIEELAQDHVFTNLIETGEDVNTDMFQADWFTARNAFILIGLVVVVVSLLILLQRYVFPSASSQTNTVPISTSDTSTVVNMLPPAGVTTEGEVATPMSVNIVESVNLQEDTHPPTPTPLPTGVAGSSMETAELPIPIVSNGVTVSTKRCYVADVVKPNLPSEYFGDIMKHDSEKYIESTTLERLSQSLDNVSIYNPELIQKILPMEPMFLFGGTVEASNDGQYSVHAEDGLQLVITNTLTTADNWLEANIGRKALLLADAPALWEAVRSCREGGDCGQIGTLLGRGSTLDVTLRVLVEPNRERMKTWIVAQDSDGIENRYLYGAMGEFGMGQLTDMTHYSQLTDTEKALFANSSYGMVLVEGFERPEGEAVRIVSTKPYGFLAYDETNQHFRHVEDWAAEACTFD